MICYGDLQQDFKIVEHLSLCITYDSATKIVCNDFIQWFQTFTLPFTFFALKNMKKTEITFFPTQYLSKNRKY